MSLLFPTPTYTPPGQLLASTSTAALLASSLCIPAPPSYTNLLAPGFEVPQDGPIVPDNYTKDLFSDFGYVVRARTDSEEDLLLWLFLYRQSALLVTNYTGPEKEIMHNTPFLNKGQNLDDYYSPGSLQWNETKDEVTWKLDGRELASSPPYYKARGEHGGIEVNLDLVQWSDLFYQIGPFTEVNSEGGGAGGILHLKASGTVTANNITYTISEGYAIHERIITAGVVPARLQYMGGRGSPWFNSWGKQFSFWTMGTDIGNDTQSIQMFINIDNQTIIVEEPLYAQINALNSWFDPKTNQINPSKWKITSITELGTLDATVTAYGRYYYTWIRRGGTILVHSYIADTVATFTRKNGTVVSEKQVSMVEYMRTLYNQGLDEVV
ncbi:uncharacterized protein BDZ99DRAFT_483059 [Mytilinidion resinicola]|uniref:Uncharacterized protein n=1 Tax=Mytilinidion resinicola TaxID=574789 RepID=A0A6A6Y0J2_9PEZI|nr:uncharacterized protein BDZ99DRAFT_483059 [Mytilinidion resinicola]KAF2802331.1 hypothetical protein BDZ99DRAFT_483059 [Mytilinidion resinicola]